MTRILESAQQEAEVKWENKLRPLTFEEFPGQQEVKEKLKVFVQAAKNRNEPLDHTLLFGPPGLGKTTLAQIIANELKAEIKITSAPAIDKKGDLAAIRQQPRSVQSFAAEVQIPAIPVVAVPVDAPSWAKRIQRR